MPSLPMPDMRALPPYAAAKIGVKFGIKRTDQARRTPWHILRGNRGFRCYFIGSVTSDFGTWLANSTQVVLAYQLAHSALTVGFVTVAQFTSPLLLGPWAGVASDRFGSRRTLIGTQVVSAMVAATLAGLNFGGLLNARVLVAGAVITGLAFTFALPARNVTVRRLVSADELKAAYAMDTVSYNLGRATAPLLTMVMVLTGTNFGWAFAANAASFFAFGVILVASPLAHDRRTGATLTHPGRISDRPQGPAHPDPAVHGGRSHHRG